MSWLQHSPSWKGCSGGSWHSDPSVPLLLLSWWAAGAGQAEAVYSLHILHPLLSSSLSAYTLFALCLNLTAPCSSINLPVIKNVTLRWQSLHSLSHPHGQEPHPNTGRYTTMKKELPKALQHTEQHIQKGNKTPLVKPGCLFQMHWNVKVISKNTKKE